MNKSVLILGIGNYDRQDDGVAWHILCGIAQKVGQSVPESPYTDEFERSDAYPHLLFDLQLYPEMVDILKEYQVICFVDAHTGAIPDELQMVSIEPQYENSPLTHHMNPQSLLSLAQTVNGTVPAAMLVSVRGFFFGFEQSLSQRTSDLAQEAVTRIMDWLESV